MNLKLVDFNQGLCDAFAEYFDGLPNVEIICDSFQNIDEYDCMVSPANSFGIMDGGVDLAISEYFGWDLMERVQAVILKKYLGEQPVGTSIIVGTGNDKHPFLAHTPTMRVPMNISHTDNIYNAKWAMLLAVYNHNQTSEKKIETVVCPSLGTGYGKMPYREAARQMSRAYRHFLKPPQTIVWHEALVKQNAIRMGGYDGFKTPMDEGKPKPPSKDT